MPRRGIDVQSAVIICGVMIAGLVLLVVACQQLTHVFAADPENPTLVFNVQDGGNQSIGSTNSTTGVPGSTLYYAINDTLTLDAYLDCSGNNWMVEIDNNGNDQYGGNDTNQVLCNTTLTTLGAHTVEASAHNGTTVGPITGTVMIMDMANATADDGTGNFSAGTVYREMPGTGVLDVNIRAYLTDGNSTVINDEAQKPYSFAWNVTDSASGNATLGDDEMLSTSLNGIDVAGNYTIEARAGDSSCTRTVNVFAFGVNVTSVPGYIVPGCSKNTVNYTISPSGFAADNVTLEVYDKNDALVYSHSTVPDTGGDHSVDWDGTGNAGALNGTALTEALSPYKIKVVASKSGMNATDDEPNQLVEEWLLVSIVDDLVEDGYASGINESTVTTALVSPRVRFNHSGGNSSWTDLSFSATNVDTAVEMLLRSGGSNHTFYVMPSDKSYELETTVSTNGVLDYADNPFDADDTESGDQKTYMFKFRIGSGGSLTILEQGAW